MNSSTPFDAPQAVEPDDQLAQVMHADLANAEDKLAYHSDQARRYSNIVSACRQALAELQDQPNLRGV